MCSQSEARVKRSYRLTRSTDFQRVRRLGKSYAHPLIVLVTAPNAGGGRRFGVVAGRAFGNAVKRNRARRRLRAALQPFLPKVISGWDVILIARLGVLQADFRDLQAALQTLLQRAHLLEVDHEQRSE